MDSSTPTPERTQRVGEALALQRLIIEDVLEGNERARIETRDEVIYVVLFHVT